MTSKSNHDISFSDIYRFLKQNRLLFLIAPVLSMLATYVYTKSVQPIWEATALIERGKLTKATGAILEMELPQPLHSLKIIDKLNHPSFLGILFAHNALDRGDSLPKMALHAKLAGGSDLVEIKARAYKPSQARRILEVSVQELQDPSNDPNGHLIKLLKTEQHSIQTNLIQLDSELRGLQARQKVSKDTSMALELMIDRKVFEKRYFDEKLRILNIQLDPTHSFPTRLASPIDVSPHPVYPKTKLLMVSAFLFGIFLSFVLGVLKNLRGIHY